MPVERGSVKSYVGCGCAFTSGCQIFHSPTEKVEHFLSKTNQDVGLVDSLSYCVLERHTRDTTSKPPNLNEMKGPQRNKPEFGNETRHRNAVWFLFDGLCCEQNRHCFLVTVVLSSPRNPPMNWPVSHPFHMLRCCFVRAFPRFVLQGAKDFTGRTGKIENKETKDW